MEKHGKLFRLTPEGKLMLPAAEDQLRALGELLVEFVEAGRLQPLSIGCGEEAAGGIVFDALVRWRPRHSEHPFRILTWRGEKRIEAVASGILDLALVTHDEAQIQRLARRELLVDRLLDDPLVLVCGTKTPWARDFVLLPDSGIGAARLPGFPLLLPERNSGIRERFDQALFTAGVLNRITIALEIGGWRTILTYAQEGVGIGLVPRSLAMRAGKGLALKPLAEELTPANTLRLICRSLSSSTEPDLSDAGHDFRKCLLQVAGVK